MCASDAQQCNALDSILYTHSYWKNAHIRQKSTTKTIKKQNPLENGTEKKKHPRNDVISSKDRQWWKSNAMHHWALFHLCVAVVFVISVSFFLPFVILLIYPVSNAMRKKQKSTDYVKQMNLIVDSGGIVGVSCYWFAMKQRLIMEKCLNQQNNKQIFQYNFNKVKCIDFHISVSN